MIYIITAIIAVCLMIMTYCIVRTSSRADDTFEQLWLKYWNKYHKDLEDEKEKTKGIF